MLSWFTENLGNIVVTLILIAIVTLIIAKMIRDKKSGKSTGGCGCGCEHCAMYGKCHN